MKLPDKITVEWHIDDVKSINPKLTDDECREVLNLALHDHDATIGINWDVLQHHINELKGVYKDL